MIALLSLLKVSWSLLACSLSGASIPRSVIFDISRRTPFLWKFLPDAYYLIVALQRTCKICRYVGETIYAQIMVTEFLTSPNCDNIFLSFWRLRDILLYILVASGEDNISKCSMKHTAVPLLFWMYFS